MPSAITSKRNPPAAGGVPVPGDAVLAAQMRRVGGGSAFFARACRQHPGVIAELLDSGELLRSFKEGEMAAGLAEAMRGCAGNDEFDRRLRLFRQRQVLRILWRDFNRTADTMETTRDLSHLAEACIAAAQDWWHEQLAREYGEPTGEPIGGEPTGRGDGGGRGNGTVNGGGNGRGRGDGNANGNASEPNAGNSAGKQQMVVLAVGKLGAGELNLSSDVDLIFTYPRAGTTVGAARPISNQEFFVKLGQRLIASLDKTTADGFVFRVDMRLRPYGQSGALVLSFDALEEYYHHQGRDWERYALIKARPVTGDPAAGAELMRMLQPFVFRRYIDFGAIDALREMKAMVNAEVRRRGMENDVKLGRGGIREVEFIAQCFQLIRGGRSRPLRQRELLRVLEALVEEGCLPAAAAEELRAAYLFLRDVEHAIQGYDDRQSQQLPDDAAARAALLLALDFDNWDAFIARLDEHRGAVSRHFNALIEPAEGPPIAPGDYAVWPDGLDAERIGELGFAAPGETAAALRQLQTSSLLQSMDAAGRDRLDRFMPLLIQVCRERENNSEALLRLLPLVQAVARRSAYLMLLLENPPALKELAGLCAASPWISGQLARHPELLDELLDPRSLYSAPDKERLRGALAEQLARLAPGDLGGHMDALRYFKEAQVLRVAASEVTGRLPLMKVSDKLTFLAEVIVEEALHLAWRDLTSKHGEPARDAAAAPPDSSANFPAGSGFTVLAYGKLGGFELGYGSDLDLVFVYDAEARGVTNGEKPIDNHVFYTRLGQRIIHILDARTPMGRLYEADLRLRPSGESGLLAVSTAAFEDYQLNRAWTWEHQALTRARVIAGDDAVRRFCEEVRRRVLSRERDGDALRREVIAMRARMREHLLPKAAAENGLFHLKQGAGGIVDIEFMVQYAVLAWCSRCPRLADWTDNLRILETLGWEGLFSSQEVEALSHAYIAFRSAAHQRDLQNLPDTAEPEPFAAARRAVAAKWRELMLDSDAAMTAAATASADSGAVMTDSTAAAARPPTGQAEQSEKDEA